ncbi:expressed unknown protein [Seminavis robusta]|uniref:Uncharacterized protein n=1 Tax=Seminavis robusta TaxID=568900 RepID=A0A9N8ELN7_9STRA|nr:expressed unknown protein [Seminavis robusta]|eukprot:Sro1361_g266180.1 n/a (278) ;mRNA; f:5596-6548
MTSSRRYSHRRIPLAARWILLLLSVSIHCRAEVPNGYEHALEVTRRLSRVDASQCGANIGEMIACFFLQCSDEPCTRQTTDVTTPTDGQETCQSLESEVCNLIDAECCPPCNEAAGAYLSCILATDEECPDSSCDAYTIVNDESAWEKSNSTNTTSSSDNDEMMLDDPPFGAGPPDNITDNGPPDNTPNGPPDNTPNGPPDDTPNGPPDDTPNGPPGTSTAKSGATTTNNIHKAESDNSMAASELDVLSVWTSGATSISSTIVGVVGAVVVINVLLI